MHRKFLVINILTNSLALKILQTLFAEPAPVKPFRGWGRGNSKFAIFPQTELAETPLKRCLTKDFFNRYPGRDRPRNELSASLLAENHHLWLRSAKSGEISKIDTPNHLFLR